MVVLSLALTIAVASAQAPPTLADDNVRIDSPTNGASVIGTIEIRGRAVTADPSKFSFYRLYYGAGSSPPALRPIGSPVDKPVDSGVLGTWDTAPLFQGEYVIQLTVYDTAGNPTMARVVVNVLPAPTPTLRNLPNVLVPVPSQTPNPDDQQDTGPTATPIPELPPLVPNIPQIDVPPPSAPPPIQPVNPSTTNPDIQPIPVGPPMPPIQQPPFNPAPIDTGPPPTFDPGPSLPPPSNPIAPVGAPPVPVIPTYQPPAPPELPATPTQIGIPP